MNEIFFETIKCCDYEVYNLSYHKKRVAKTIGFNINLEEYIYPIKEELLKCKVIYDKNGIINIEYLPYKKRIINTFQLVFDDLITYSAKAIHRENIDDLYLQKGAEDDIIIVKNGLITDTSIANIAIFYQEKWLTPKKPLLYGTTRERYLSDGLIYEENINIHMLKQCTKVGLLNAMIDFDIITDFKIEGTL